MNARKTRTSIAAAALAANLAASALAAPTYIPVLNGQFSMGQWYFNGERSSLGGNAGLTIVPAIRFSNRFALIPTFSSQYLGTRSAEELAGGNTLFQDTWENSVGVKAVHSLNARWNVKERVGGRIKWFRETTDENWNKGLYDYRTATVGAELERHWHKRASISLGYDYSILTFPNYSSLESTQSDDLAREFAGTDVLDQRIHLFTLNGRAPLFGSTSGTAQLYWSPREYTDQTIVIRSGLLTAQKREDKFKGAALGIETPLSLGRKTKLVASANAGVSDLDSNQNHYDARLNTFVGNFYDYRQNSVEIGFTLLVARPSGLPMAFDLSGSLSRRDYSDRVIQAEDGTYLSEKLHTEESAVNLGFSYPLNRNVRVRLTSTFGRSRSNNLYESVYRYNFNNSNYQFGFSYDY